MVAFLLKITINITRQESSIILGKKRNKIQVKENHMGCQVLCNNAYKDEDVAICSCFSLFQIVFFK